MLIIGKRIIAVLTASTELTSALGGSGRVVAEASSVAHDKRVHVSLDVGQDQNSIPADIGEVSIYVVVKESETNPITTSLEITTIIDNLLNQGEVVLSNTEYPVKNIIRQDTDGPYHDQDRREYVTEIVYSYILKNKA